MSTRSEKAYRRNADVKSCICSKLLQDMPLEDALRISRDIGYEGMEVFGLPQHLPPDIDGARLETVAGMMKDMNIEPVSICSYLGKFEQMGDEEAERQVADFKRYLDIAARLKCDKIRLIAQNLPLEKVREDHFMRWAHWGGVCADLARPYGVSILLENHMPLFATVEWTMKIVRMMGRDNVVIDYDPINLFVWDAPGNYGPEAVRRFGKSIANVQVKDAVKTEVKTNTRLLLGDGVIEWPAIVRALRAIGYDGYLSAECERKTDATMSGVDIARHEFGKIRELCALR